ncbi:MAG: helix-turn-helix domain-containing protein [Verrucomicrobiota bacterium]
MENNEKQQRFIELRTKGWTYARIAEELGVHRNTILNWSRQFQFQIQNARVIEDEALANQYFATREARWKTLADTLQRVVTETEKRDLSTVPTAQLFAVAAAIRREIQRETVLPTFTMPVAHIPASELPSDVHVWQV